MSIESANRMSKRHVQNAINAIEQQMFSRISSQSQSRSQGEESGMTMTVDDAEDDDDDDEEVITGQFNVQDFIRVVDTQILPKMTFHSHNKIFSIEPSLNQTSLFGDANDRAQMHRERYNMIRQIIERSQVLLSAIKGFRLTSIESLHGSEGSKYICGMLVKHSSREIHLEDLSAHVKLDLSQAKRTTGFYTEGSMVIVGGAYNSDEMTFVVSQMTLAPLEKRKDTILFNGQQHHGFESQLYQNVEQDRTQQQQQLQHNSGNERFISDSQTSTFSVSTPTDSHSSTAATSHRQYRERVKKYESTDQAASAFIVIIADVWLDQPKVLNKLKTMFSGFSDAEPPACFVLMGNFMSRPFLFGMQQNDREQYRKNFDQLADIITQFPSLLNGQTKFVFVPGPQDPGFGNVLPRSRIPDLFIRDFKERIGHSNVHFATNPTRLRCFSREVVLFREDLQRKLLNELVPRNEDTKFKYHVVQSVVNNYHLCPLPLNVSPIIWKQDYAMRLCPLPDLLVLADKSERFQVPDPSHPEEQFDEYPLCINPSSFPADMSFVCYYPVQNRAQWNRIVE